MIEQFASAALKLLPVLNNLRTRVVVHSCTIPDMGVVPTIYSEQLNLDGIQPKDVPRNGKFLCDRPRNGVLGKKCVVVLANHRKTPVTVVDVHVQVLTSKRPSCGTYLFKRPQGLNQPTELFTELGDGSKGRYEVFLNRNWSKGELYRNSSLTEIAARETSAFEIFLKIEPDVQIEFEVTFQLQDRRKIKVRRTSEGAKLELISEVLSADNIYTIQLTAECGHVVRSCKSLDEAAEKMLQFED